MFHSAFGLVTLLLDTGVVSKTFFVLVCSQVARRYLPRLRTFLVLACAVSSFKLTPGYSSLF